MEIDQLKKLAQLARLEVPEAELASVASEMGAILGFVDEIQKVELDESQQALRETNVFREDIASPLESAHDLVEAAALHQDHFVKVPKVITD